MGHHALISRPPFFVLRLSWPVKNSEKRFFQTLTETLAIDAPELLYDHLDVLFVFPIEDSFSELIYVEGFCMRMGRGAMPIDVKRIVDCFKCLCSRKIDSRCLRVLVRGELVMMLIKVPSQVSAKILPISHLEPPFPNRAFFSAPSLT